MYSHFGYFFLLQHDDDLMKEKRMLEKQLTKVEHKLELEQKNNQLMSKALQKVERGAKENRELKVHT